MNRLLSANFMRLRKSKEFWLCALSTLVISAAMIYSGSKSASELAARGYIKPLDEFYFQLAPYIGAILAIFISLFLGTEYSDGTIRNKVIAGHTRTKIYLVNFLTCFAAGTAITVMWFVGGLPGLYLIGSFEMGLPGVISYFFIAVGMVAVQSAIYVWIGTVSQNKASTVVFVLILWFAMTLAASGIYDRLYEREYIGGMTMMIDGELVTTENTPNPLYLGGSARAAVEWLCRLWPTGQAFAMMDAGVTTPVLDIAVSVLVTVLITVRGIRSYRKKDLR